jgi:aspartate-semialdehyde dehydrogenase
MVGQRFVEQLTKHPWFEVTHLAASEKSTGKPYKEAVNWLMDTPLPPGIGELIVQPCEPTFDCKLVFSGLDSSVAGGIETAFANNGYTVVSNSSNHRQDADVPLMIPEVNQDHLEVVKRQKSYPGMIITNPNCSTIGLTLALKPLCDLFGVEQVNVVTMQAISGAGYPGIASLDILDNVIPYIAKEEEKLEQEPLKILGKLTEKGFEPATIKLSAQCNRVPVSCGHLECVSLKLKRKASKEEIINAWRSFKGVPQIAQLPSAPEQPIHYFEQDNYPQPKLHRDLDKGMAVSIGRLRECPLLDYKFVLLSHNTIRGAAGGSILIAEEMLRQGMIFW